MTAVREIPWEHPQAIRAGILLTGDLIAGREIPVFAVSEDEQLAVANFLGYLLTTFRMAAALDPKDPAAIAGDGRGEDLARALITDGLVEACDYCGALMLHALAASLGRHMHLIHGDHAAEAWGLLATALLPPALPPRPRPPLTLTPDPYTDDLPHPF